MRRTLVPLILMLTLSAVTPASASSWRAFSSSKLAFSLRYPAGWQLTSSTILGTTQVLIQHAGAPMYAITIQVLPLKAGQSPTQTVSRFVTFERRSGNAQYDRLNWSAVTLGGKPAMAGISAPPTEGGAPVANGVYVAGWRSRVYEITITAYGHPAPAQLSRFPRIYQQILATWRFH